MRRVKLGDARQVLICRYGRVHRSAAASARRRVPRDARGSRRRPICSCTSIDASVDDRDRRTDAVRSVLAEVGATPVPTIEVFNKIDLLDRHELAGLRARASGRAVHLGRDRGGPRRPDRGDRRAARDGCRTDATSTSITGRETRPPAGGRSLSSRARRQPRASRRARRDRGGRAAPVDGPVPARTGAGMNRRRRRWPRAVLTRSRWRPAPKTPPAAPPASVAPRFPDYPTPDGAGDADRAAGCARAPRRRLAAAADRRSARRDARLQRGPEALAGLLSGRDGLGLSSCSPTGSTSRRRCGSAPALARDNRYLPAWQGLADAQLGAGNATEAVAALERLVALDPKREAARSTARAVAFRQVQALIDIRPARSAPPGRLDAAADDRSKRRWRSRRRAR